MEERIKEAVELAVITSCVGNTIQDPELDEIFDECMAGEIDYHTQGGGSFILIGLRMVLI